MADKHEKWRRDAERLLKEPVVRKRSLETVVGKVDNLFDSIHDARSRGMSWDMIKQALSPDGSLSTPAIESAFKRLCEERGATVPRRSQSVKRKRERVEVSVPTVTAGDKQVDEGSGDLFQAPPRHSDEGLD